jgi:hypothetical protein
LDSSPADEPHLTKQQLDKPKRLSIRIGPGIIDR